jgi:hypothetical protein
VIAGLFLGWVWLTREEGLWLAPGLAVMAAGGLYRAFVDRHLLRFAAAGLAVVAAFGAVNAGFRAINWTLYGTPVGVEYKEPNFVRAIGAIHSVRSGEVKPFVSVTRATRQKIYPVSPSFAELAPYLDGPPGEDWGKHICEIPVHRDTCGEIGGGVFAWALRGATSAAGHYTSPAEASAFYGRVADEIGAACDKKQLACERQVFAELPPYGWSQLGTIPQRIVNAIATVLSARWQSVDGGPSAGVITQFRNDLAFLNFPLVARAPATKMFYTLHGWYYRQAGGWFSATISDHGQPIAVSFERMASPDLVAWFKDSGASNQRFEMRTFCDGACVLRLAGEDGSAVERALSEVTPTGLRLGDGYIHFDAVGTELSELFPPEQLHAISHGVRDLVMRNFEFLRVPLLIVGLIAAFGCLVWWRDAPLNAAYVLGMAMWALAASRILLIALLDATFVTAITPVYLAPSGFAMTAGAVMSIAAWLQLRSA